MVAKKYENYIVENIRRINIRYYLLRIHGRYYIIDYVNPRNFKSYFLPFSRQTEWLLYDVTEDREKYGKENISFWKLSQKILNTLWLLIVFEMMLAPKSFNLYSITYSTYISNHWGIMMIAVIIGAVSIMTIFLSISNSVNLEDKKSYKLRIAKNQDKEYNSLVRFLITIIFSIIFSFIGIGGSSYIGLILFAFLCNYSLWFNNFIEIPFTQSSKKYKVYSNES